MNGCSYARRVFQITSSGAELSRDLASHAARCSFCQESLERAGRFERELVDGASSLSTAPMPNLAAIDSVQVRRSQFPLLPVLGTMATAVLLVAVAFSALDLSAPTGSMPTPTPIPSPVQSTASPSPLESPSADPTLAPTADATLVPVPQEVVNRSELPSCGAEVVERTGPGDVFDADVRDCFWNAYGAGEAAEFTSDVLSVEGGRIQRIYRLLPTGELEVFTDSTQDPLSTPEWTRQLCDGLREVESDPAGTVLFEAEGCDDLDVIS